MMLDLRGLRPGAKAGRPPGAQNYRPFRPIGTLGHCDVIRELGIMSLEPNLTPTAHAYRYLRKITFVRHDNENQ